MPVKRLRSHAFLLLAGLLFAGVGSFGYVKEKEALEAGEPVEAEILSSRVVEEESTSSTRRNGRRRTETSTTYYPSITYRYEVEGKDYRSSKVTPGFGRSSKGREWAEQIVAEHPEGAVTTAFVDPAAPDRAFLVEESSRVLYFIFIGVGVALAVGALVGAGRAFSRRA